MNRKLLMAALYAATIAATSAAHSFAFANEAGDHDFSRHLGGSLTRDEVRAERIAAAARGEIEHGEAGRTQFSGASLKSREQVRAEFFEARRLGLLGVGEKNARDATPEEVQLIAAAGLRAAQMAARTN